MNVAIRLCAGLLLACTLAGCCWAPGYFEPVSGRAYGGGWYPCCWGNPFCLFQGGPGWGWHSGWGHPGYGTTYGTPVPMEGYGWPSVVSPPAGSPGCGPECKPQPTMYSHPAPSPAPMMYSGPLPEVPAGLFEGPTWDGTVYEGPVYQGEVYDEGTTVSPSNPPPPAPPAENTATSYRQPHVIHSNPGALNPPPSTPAARHNANSRYWVPARF